MELYTRNRSNSIKIVIHTLDNMKDKKERKESNVLDNMEKGQLDEYLQNEIKLIDEKNNLSGWTINIIRKIGSFIFDENKENLILPK